MNDDIQQQLALLRQEIIEIKQELAQAKRQSVRDVLQAELREKETQRDILLNTTGDANSFAAENMVYGSQVGGDINQYNQPNSINASGSFGDHTVLAMGQNVYIYPDPSTVRDLTPISISMDFTCQISRSVEYTTIEEGFIFKNKKQIAYDVWIPTAPFQVTVDIRDLSTSKVKHIVLHEGVLFLEEKCFSSSQNGKEIVAYPSQVRTLWYLGDENQIYLVQDKFMQVLTQLSQDGYDVDQLIIDKEPGAIEWARGYVPKFFMSRFGFRVFQEQCRTQDEHGQPYGKYEMYRRSNEDIPYKKQLLSTTIKRRSKA